MWLHAALHRPCMHAIIITINHHLVNCEAFITQAFKRKRCTQLQRSSWQSPCLSAFKSTNTKSTKKPQSQIGLAGLLANQTSLQITRQTGLFKQENIRTNPSWVEFDQKGVFVMYILQMNNYKAETTYWLSSFTSQQDIRGVKLTGTLSVYLSLVSWVPLNPLKSLQMTVL